MMCFVCNRVKGAVAGVNEDLSGVKVFTYIEGKTKRYTQRMYCSEACYDECTLFNMFNMFCLECCEKPAAPEHCLAIQYTKNGNFTRYRPMCSVECNIKAMQKASLVEEFTVSLCMMCRKFAHKKCSKCHIATYCSLECQQHHWITVHKKECCV